MLSAEALTLLRHLDKFLEEVGSFDAHDPLAEEFKRLDICALCGQKKDLCVCDGSRYGARLDNSGEREGQ